MTSTGILAFAASATLFAATTNSKKENNYNYASTKHEQLFDMIVKART